MVLTSSDFRKNLFGALDAPLKGEPLEVSYKGSSLKIVPVGPPVSKIARAHKQDILNVPAESIIGNEELLKDLELEWDRESKEF